MLIIYQIIIEKLMNLQKYNANFLEEVVLLLEDIKEVVMLDVKEVVMEDAKEDTNDHNNF